MGFEETMALVKRDIEADSLDYATDYRPDSSALGHALHLAAFASVTTGTIIEIGTDGGFGTAALAWGARMSGASVYTFDIRADRQQHAQERLAKAGFSGVYFHLGTAEIIESVIADQRIGLAFIDGNHSYEWCLHDIQAIARLSLPSTRILLHDFPHTGHACFKKFSLEENGVYEAVTDFLKRNPGWLGMPLTGGTGFVLLARREDLWGVN